MRRCATVLCALRQENEKRKQRTAFCGPLFSYRGERLFLALVLRGGGAVVRGGVDDLLEVGNVHAQLLGGLVGSGGFGRLDGLLEGLDLFLLLEDALRQRIRLREERREVALRGVLGLLV